MLHRLKLRLLYGTWLRDKAARRKEMRVILISGFLVYLPFLGLAYLIAFETRRLYLITIGLLSACTCIPVVFYAYSKGCHKPLKVLFEERRAELFWLGLKIGFLYALILYFMILGIVEFLFGYSVVRAAMISFVAAAVARDGFEIGFLRAQRENQPIAIFPDGEDIGPFLRSIPLWNRLLMMFFLTGSIGFFLGPVLKNAVYQAVAVGLLGGVMTLTAGHVLTGTSLAARIRLFLWPGFTMAATYFLTLAYLVRNLFQVSLSPSSDLGFLTALPATWLTAEILFLAHLKQKRG